MNVTVGGNTVSIQVQSSGLGAALALNRDAAAAVVEANAAAAAAAASQTAAAQSATDAAAELGLAARKAQNGADFADRAEVLVNLGVRTYSLLNALSSADRATVLAGGDPGNIGATLNALLLAAPSGSVVDASMLRGTITLEANPLDGLVDAPVTLITGPCTIRMDFNTLGSLALAHGFTLQMEGTVIEPSSNLTTWPGQYTQGFGIVSTAFWDGLASGTSAATTLDVPDGSYFRAGSRIAVSGINEFTNIQVEIVEALTASTPSSISFASPENNTIGDSVVYLKVGSEIIQVTVASNGETATVGARGCLGTTAASHSAGSTATLMLAEVFQVTGVSGDTLTLDHALPMSFTDARWWAGAVGARVTGWGKIDGKYDRVFALTKIWSAVLSTLSQDFSLSGNIEITRAPFSGVFLQAAFDPHVDIPKITLVGKPADNIGGSVWLFSGTKDADVRVRELDDGYIGVMLDPKSSNVNTMGLAEPVDDCTVSIGHIKAHTFPTELSAGQRDSVTIGVDESASGPYVNNCTPQYTTAIEPADNVISIGWAKNFGSYATEPRIRNATGNTVLINGQNGRIIEVDVDVPSDFAVNSQETAYVNYTVTGAKATDRFAMQQVDALPLGVIAVPVKPSIDDTFRVLYSNCYPFAALVTAGNTFTARVTGPWNE